VPPLDVVKPEVERRLGLQHAQPADSLGRQREGGAEAIAFKRILFGLRRRYDHLVRQAGCARAVERETVLLEHGFAFEQL